MRFTGQMINRRNSTLVIQVGHRAVLPWYAGTSAHLLLKRGKFQIIESSQAVTGIVDTFRSQAIGHVL